MHPYCLLSRSKDIIYYEYMRHTTLTKGVMNFTIVVKDSMLIVAIHSVCLLQFLELEKIIFRNYIQNTLCNWGFGPFLQPRGNRGNTTLTVLFPLLHTHYIIKVVEIEIVWLLMYDNRQNQLTTSCLGNHYQTPTGVFQFTIHGQKKNLKIMNSVICICPLV